MRALRRSEPGVANAAVRCPTVQEARCLKVPEISKLTVDSASINVLHLPCERCRPERGAKAASQSSSSGRVRTSTEAYLGE